MEDLVRAVAVCIKRAHDAADARPRDHVEFDAVFLERAERADVRHSLRPAAAQREAEFLLRFFSFKKFMIPRHVSLLGRAVVLFFLGRKFRLLFRLFRLCERDFHDKNDEHHDDERKQPV